jgi:hypothetical protein
MTIKTVWTQQELADRLSISLRAAIRLAKRLHFPTFYYQRTTFYAFQRSHSFILSLSGPKPLLTISEIAKLYNYSRQHTRRLLKANSIPLQNEGGKFFVYHADLIKLQPKERQWRRKKHQNGT